MPHVTARPSDPQPARAAGQRGRCVLWTLRSVIDLTSAHLYQDITVSFLPSKAEAEIGAVEQLMASVTVLVGQLSTSESRYASYSVV